MIIYDCGVIDAVGVRSPARTWGRFPSKALTKTGPAGKRRLYGPGRFGGIAGARLLERAADGRREIMFHHPFLCVFAAAVS